MTNDDSAKLPPVPVGIQRLLRLAATDKAFLAELEKSPELAAASAEVPLTANELAILRAIPPEQLRHMTNSLPQHDIASQAAPDLPPIAPQGIRPDQPPEPPHPPVAPAGIRPDQLPDRPPENPVSFGIDPDEPPSRPPKGPAPLGNLPDEPPPRTQDRFVSTGILPDEPLERSSKIYTSHGILPDEPLERSSKSVAFGGVRPDKPPERSMRNAISKGIRPTPIVAAAAALVIGGIAVAECTGTCDRLLEGDTQSTDEPGDD